MRQRRREVPGVAAARARRPIGWQADGGEGLGDDDDTGEEDEEYDEDDGR